MAHASDRKERWQEVLEEHRALQRHLSLLAEWAASPPPRDGEWGAELSRRAATVATDLREHFAGEAEESFFREIETKAPHLSQKMASLRTEHATILSELGKVAETSPGASGRGADRAAARVRAVLALIQRHEAEENELMFRAIYEDMGVGD